MKGIRIAGGGGGLGGGCAAGLGMIVWLVWLDPGLCA